MGTKGKRVSKTLNHSSLTNSSHSDVEFPCFQFDSLRYPKKLSGYEIVEILAGDVKICVLSRGRCITPPGAQFSVFNGQLLGKHGFLLWEHAGEMRGLDCLFFRFNFSCVLGVVMTIILP